MAVTYDFQTPGVSTSAADTQEDIRNIAEMSWVWHVNASQHTLTNKPTGLIEAFYTGSNDLTTIIPAYGIQNNYTLRAYDGTNLGNVNFGELYVDRSGAVLSNTVGARGREFIAMGVAPGYFCESLAIWNIYADYGNTGTSTYDPILAFGNQGTERARIYTDTSDSHKLKFDVGGSDQMVIDSAGNVGIGTSSPAFILDVFNSDAGNNAVVNIQDAANNAYLRFDTNSNVSYIEAISSGGWNFNIGGANRVTFDTSGNVGIGTSSPSRQLDIENISSNPFVSLVTSTTRDAGIFFGDTDSDSRGRVYYQNSVDDMSFYTAGTEKVRISSSGNVGIGTSSPSSFSAAGNNLVVGSGSGDEGLTIFSGSSNGGKIYFADGTSGDQAYRGWVTYEHNTESLQLGAGAGTRLTIENSGNVEVNNGNLVIGTSGKGIDFSATSNVAGTTSELLDDYEEGTFTPTLVTTGTNFTSVGYAVSTKGRYTKIGNTVHIYIRLATTSVNKGSGAGAATGEVAIGGLPFTCNSDIYLNYPVSVLTQNWLANPPAGAQVIQNTKLIYLYQNQGSTGDITNTSVSDVGTGSNNNDVTIVATYRV